MIIEFRNADGDVVARQSTGGDTIKVVAATEAQYAERMINFGAPVEFAKRAAARHTRALANPRTATRDKSLADRIAAATAAVQADLKAGRLLDAQTQARIAAATKIVNADKMAGLV